MDTGFDNLNSIIHGLHAKTLVIVAAVPAWENDVCREHDRERDAQ